jgi:hypothetical protein
MQLLLHLWTDFDASWLKMKIMVCRCAWSGDFTVRWFLQELWPLTTLGANYTTLSTQLLHLWTDFDARWLKMKTMVCRCAWSGDFTVRWFLQELWPLTLSANYTFLGKPCQRNSSYIYDPSSTWRAWCVDVHEVWIFRLDNFYKSYGPWHLAHLCRCFI